MSSDPFDLVAFEWFMIGQKFAELGWQAHIEYGEDKFGFAHTLILQKGEEIHKCHSINDIQWFYGKQCYEFR